MLGRSVVATVKHMRHDRMILLKAKVRSRPAEKGHWRFVESMSQRAHFLSIRRSQGNKKASLGWRVQCLVGDTVVLELRECYRSLKGLTKVGKCDYYRVQCGEIYR